MQAWHNFYSYTIVMSHMSFALMNKLLGYKHLICLLNNLFWNILMHWMGQQYIYISVYEKKKILQRKKTDAKQTLKWWSIIVCDICDFSHFWVIQEWGEDLHTCTSKTSKTHVRLLKHPSNYCYIKTQSSCTYIFKEHFNFLLKLLLSYSPIRVFFSL